jgi:hypothetical protein
MHDIKRGAAYTLGKVTDWNGGCVRHSIRHTLSRQRRGETPLPARTIREHAFENADGRIEHGLVILQKTDEGLHLRGAWIDLAAVHRHFLKARRQSAQ